MDISQHTSRTFVLAVLLGDPHILDINFLARDRELTTIKNIKAQQRNAILLINKLINDNNKRVHI